ncbi:DUF3185 family protein [Halovivax gelatinilyticus]|uniref:DUF3185 family protein n=1 Tax=Halovivax gelatinilyticus TaxID=2961597 RepID=UPI0020CA964D|nr:DUF3185 family protein [Halovivax gelatinilyticus]
MVLTPFRVYSGIGVILVIIGIVMLFYGHDGLQQYDSMSGDFARAVSESHQEQYEQYWWIRTIGGVIAVLGLGEIVAN